MNRNELEQWMKESLGNQEFLPGEEGWNKLQAAMHPAAREDRKKGLILLLPAKLKAAAAIALLVSAGTAVYLLTHSNHNNEITIAQNPNAKPVISPTPSYEIPDTEGQNNTPALSATAVRLHTSTPARTATYGHAPVQVDTQHIASHPATQPIAQQEDLIVQPDKRHKDLPISVPYPSPDIKEKENGRHINVGVAAQFGKVSVGNMQYQVGVVAYRNISDKFYAKATLALAATDVGFTQQNNFKSFTTNSFGSSVDERKVDAQYGGNIYSVGIAPNIGYRITKRFAVSCGVAVYRNLEQSVSLQNRETITPASLDNDIVNTEKPISTWDAGVTGSATYQAGKRLSIDVQYRHGISAYMYTNNQPIRNSGVGIGLSYLFNR